jgi:hypothetical protein
MQSNNVALRLYEGMEVMFLMTLLYSQIKTATEKQCFVILEIRDDTILVTVVSG